MFILINIPISFYLNAQDLNDKSLTLKLKQHVVFLSSDSLEGRGVGTQGRVITQDYIAQQFKEIGLEHIGDNYFQKFELRNYMYGINGLGVNVVGYIEGNDSILNKEYIIIGAHYDHVGYLIREQKKIVYNGADDNASGVSAIIEMARYFYENKQKLKRSIMFVAFDAEELGLLGSKNFMSADLVYSFFKYRKMNVMFSLDMIGRYSENKGIDLKGVASLNGGVDIAKTLAVSQNITLKDISPKIEERTDTWNFGRSGIPAIHVFTGENKLIYHTPKDTAELLDYDGMTIITKYIQSLVAEMSLMPTLIPSKNFSAKGQSKKQFNAGFILNVGTSHNNYKDDFFRAKYVFAYCVGGFIQINKFERLSIQPEILYDFNGSRSANGKFYRQSVTIPLNTHIDISPKYDDNRAYFIFGGYYRHNFGGKDGGKSLDYSKIYNKQEWGANIGFGMQIEKVQIAFIWTPSLTSISKVKDFNVFNTGQFISFGYIL